MGPIKALSSVMLAASLARSAGAQANRTPPIDPAHLQPVNVKAESVTYKGRPATRLIASSTDSDAFIALLPGIEFGDGVIELDLAGDTAPDADPTFRAFTGIAFRVEPKGTTYEAFYLRPKNGRSEDQLQRNHSAQYISPPEFPWQRLRKETPGAYESYVDLVPGEWTKIKVEVHGSKAKLYVNGATQPTLIVNDLKQGISHGGIALWIGPGSISHFSNLRITP